MACQMRSTPQPGQLFVHRIKSLDKYHRISMIYRVVLRYIRADIFMFETWGIPRGQYQHTLSALSKLRKVLTKIYPRCESQIQYLVVLTITCKLIRLG